MRFQDPAKAREFFEQKMTFTTGPVELNRMLKDENNRRQEHSGVQMGR